MARVVLAAVILVAIPLHSRAEDAVVHLNVRPMRAPKRALAYQLLPEVRELNPGNAAQNYLKCFMEQRLFFFTKESAADRTRYQAMPLAELPLANLRGYGGSALRQADWAARLDTLDWQILDRIQDGGMDVLPAELGPLQVLATALHVRFRAEVAGRQFDDGVRTAKTLFALSRHLGEHPTAIANRVGLSAAHLGLSALGEMVQQPGCPNLYWALTDLPCPLVDLRKGVQGECSLVAAELKPIRDDSPMPEAEIEAVVSRLSGVMSLAREQAGQAPRSMRSRLQAKVKDPAGVAAARRRLAEAGTPADSVQKFPPLQAILLDEKRDYVIHRDDRIKLLALPLWQIESLIDGEERTPNGDGLFADLLPPIHNLRRTQGGLEQQIALLRHVEALRLYAAEHDGKLPATLSDISVPLPLDPVTGEPFLYTVEGTTAHLRGRTPRREGKDSGFNVNYEITLQK
jgi:hypothetical protein